LGLYDMLGRQRELVPLNSADAKIQLDVGYLPQGLYIIRVSRSGQVLATDKLIISR